MKSVQVTIQGSSPLLMHAFPMVAVEGFDKKSPHEQAAHHLYLHPDTGVPYIPGVNFQRGLVAAAAFSKGKGRGSLAKVAAAAILVEENYLVVSPPHWVVDSRPVVIPATKGRVIRHRARFDRWQVTAIIHFDEVLMTEAQLRRCVDDLGSRVGILDFRPEKRGPFGRFMVTAWKKD